MAKKRRSIDSPAIYSEQTEKAVLATMLLEPNFVDLAFEHLSAEDFYDARNKKIFEILKHIYQKGGGCDAVVLKEELKSKRLFEDFISESYVNEILAALPEVAHPALYVQILKDLSLKRHILSISAELSNEALGGDLTGAQLVDLADQKWLSLIESLTRKTYVNLSEALSSSLNLISETLSQQRYSKDNFLWMPTKFPDLNKLIGGLQKSDLIVIAARPGMGKTAFALNLAADLAIEKDIPIAFFSLEMSKEQLGLRILSMYSKVDCSGLKTGSIDEESFSKLISAGEEIANKPLFIDDSAGLTLSELRAKTRRLVKEQKIRAIFIDYLQLIRNLAPNIHTREQEIAEISRNLKGLAKDLNIPVVALAQLNRAVEGRENKKPVLSDLRESGAIEQDADIIMFLFREEVYRPTEENQNIAEVIVAKHRNGPTGSVKLVFEKQFLRFSSYIGQTYQEKTVVNY